ncbi:MAG: lysoplasmalogenase [Actinomycetales bacterium]|nr:lysoplasmalogenase [Actinomycetales bacterium]
MNLYAWVLLAALAVTAAVDWFAVARSRREIEVLAKPAFMVILIALAWLLHADTVTYGQQLLLGLVLCLVGDVLLLGDGPASFLGGLIAFLLGHVAYIAAFRRVPSADPMWGGIILVTVVVLVLLWFRLLPKMVRDWRDGAPLVLYAVIIGLMAVLGWATGHLVVAIGGTLFLVSDAVLAYNRFERQLVHGRLIIMVTYHLAQFLIVWGLLRV